MKKDTIPQTDSIKELADFWDTHDVADYADELVEVREAVFSQHKVLEIELNPEEFNLIEKQAQSKGLSDSELIHEWVREKLKAA